MQHLKDHYEDQFRKPRDRKCPVDEAKKLDEQYRVTCSHRTRCLLENYLQLDGLACWTQGPECSVWPLATIQKLTEEEGVKFDGTTPIPADMSWDADNLRQDNPPEDDQVPLLLPLLAG